MQEKAILLPYITEKSQILTQKGEYVFKVSKDLTKPEIKKIIEKKYKEKIEKIRIVNVRPKEKRLGQIVGHKKGFKKAIVKLKEGQKIDLFIR